MTRIMFILGFVFCCIHTCGPARAAEVTVELVAVVQDAIRWNRPRWGYENVSQVTDALNETREPQVMLAIAVIESSMRQRAIAWHRGRTVADVGLCGVRCVLKGGRCSVGPAKGMTVAALKSASANVRVAAAILATKRARHGARAFDGYNGDRDGSNRYGDNVRAIVAAFGGVVDLKRVKKRRVRDLARLIAAAVVRGGES